jgi:drug/metabolite transporter (DMT)-like permease
LSWAVPAGELPPGWQRRLRICGFCVGVFWLMNVTAPLGRTVRSECPSRLPAAGSVLVQQACALVFAIALFMVTYLVRPVPALGAVSGWAWASAIASGVLYYAVAFGFYLAGLRLVSASVAATFLTLIPVFGVSASYLLLGEHLSGRLVDGEASERPWCGIRLGRLEYP